MKEFFIKDCLKIQMLDKELTILGWVKSKRCHNNILFIQLIDSSGEIQIIFEKNKFPLETFNVIKKLSINHH